MAGGEGHDEPSVGSFALPIVLPLFQHVSKLIECFPEREQRIVNLYYFEDLTLREIAGQLGLTEARISQILSKMLGTLRGCLVETRTAA